MLARGDFFSIEIHLDPAPYGSLDRLQVCPGCCAVG